MNLKSLRSQLTRIQTWVAILIVLGIFFRFYNLDYKVYWFDETQTSLRISGHTRRQMLETVYDGKVRTVESLLEQYQYPNDDRDLHDTLDALAGSPEHAPLYFLGARFWLQLFGHSTSVIRSLSALISLFALPCLYWLSWELFQSAAVSWFATVLIAISPFHVLYAQEARQYSLWTVTILLASATLLRALRRSTRLSWSTYAVSIALALYTHTFSVLILLGHGIYVALVEGWRSARSRNFIIAALAGIGLFVPWLRVILDNFSLFSENTASVNVDRPDLYLIWGLNLSRLFFDLNQGPSWINPVPYLLFALVIAAFYFLYRHAPARTWIFVVILAGVTGFALIGPDVILGGRRSSITRYAIPSFLAIELAVAYFLTCKLPIQHSKFNTQNSKWPSRWRTIAIALISSGVISCAVNSQAQVWWHKSHSKSFHNPQVARIVNRSDRPLVISDQNPGMILSFSHLLQEDVRLQLIVKPAIPQLPAGFSDIYLYRPTDNLRAGLERDRQVNVAPVFKNWLWKVDRP
jgi:uncharacterized membrane protein